MKHLPTELASARQDIESVDKQLIQLLKQRLDVVKSVAQYKKGQPGAELYDPDRESQVANLWQAEATELGLSAYHAGRILREVLNYSRRTQEPEINGLEEKTACTVGYQGVAASYSDLAITKLFENRSSQRVESIGLPRFSEVFDALESGRVDYALVPVDNTLVGSIGEVNQLLATRDVAVVDEEIWEVEHCLAVVPGATTADLRVIRSHPVALQQCLRLLSDLKPVEAEQYFDTAGAAESVSYAADPRIGCLCSPEAAVRSGLEVLRTNVADHERNHTRFLLLARAPEDASPKLPVKTTIQFTVNDHCGSLASSLAAFSRHDVNLTRLESRPQPEAPWKYLFLADLEGHQEAEPVRAALAELIEQSQNVRVLGSYPSRAVERNQVPSPLTTSIATVPSRVETPPASPVENAATPAFEISGVPIGGNQFTLILGPCAVESAAQMKDAAEMVKAHGAHLMRGGAFKPRSSPHSFQGLGFEGLSLLAQAGADFELPIVTEVLQPEDVEAIAEKADVLQVGARNMQNFSLLKRLGKTRRPILLKRGMSATLKELLQAAEYILDGGNQRVILCERGIRTFETSTRSTLDVSAIPVLKSKTHLPVLVDPSHAAGVRDLVVPLALAAAAAGADGLMVECHPRPEEALCDKDQALRNQELDQLLQGLRPILHSQGRSL